MTKTATAAQARRSADAGADIALVTGASRGIGLAIARALNAAGTRVIGAARTITPELTEVASATVAVDLADPEAGARLIDHIHREVGALDCVINNAGGGDPEDIILESGFGIPDDAWRRLFDLNLFAPVRLTRAALPMLKQSAARGISCSIVNVSSIGALEPSAAAPLPYSAAKAALNNWSKALARALAPNGIRVNTVSPGPTETDIWTGPSSLGAALAANAGLDHKVFLDNAPTILGMPNARFIQPEEVAAAVAFLVSSSSSAIVGANIVVDGGLAASA